MVKKSFFFFNFENLIIYNFFFLDGLFVCLTQFVGVCIKHLEIYVNKTGCKAFLNIKNEIIEVDKDGEPLDKVVFFLNNKKFI